MLEVAVQISTLVGLAMVGLQVWSNNRWNRRVSNFNFIDTATTGSLELNARRAIEDRGIAFRPVAGWSINDVEASSLFENRDSSFAVNQFPNDLNNLCVAYRFGILDKKCSYVSTAVESCSGIVSLVRISRLQELNTRTQQSGATSPQQLVISADQSERAASLSRSTHGRRLNSSTKHFHSSITICRRAPEGPVKGKRSVSFALSCL